ncbi:MAG: M20/M25/M40 family metallo-hydrolase [Candidatus Saccharicenans sp.]
MIRPLAQNKKNNIFNTIFRNLFLTIALVAIFAHLAFGWANQTKDNSAPASYENQAKIIKDLGLKEEKAYELLKVLTSVGGRLTGSQAAEQAVNLMGGLMEKIGLDRVWTEPVKVNHWTRGSPEKAFVRSRRFGQQKINICALGNSIGTPGKGLEAQVLEVKSWAELESLKSQVPGKIVFYNVPMDRTIVYSFAAYGQAAQYRVRGASQAARYGAVAVLTRSLTFRLDNHPHTGMMIYDDKLPRIPAASISTLDSERLAQWLKADPDLKIYLRMACQQLEPVISHNVIGELKGAEKPEEIILLGGHLDSWDLSPGANDDAAGCVVALEALRLLKEAGLKPKRTIRAVLFMDEEFGGTGGRAYVLDSHRLNEKHLVAIEQDEGGGLPLGLSLSREEAINKLRAINQILRPLGVYWIEKGGGGVDVSPLASKGVILGSLVPDSQKYFDYHHSALDTIETIHPRELELQAIILAMVVYFFAEEGV